MRELLDRAKLAIGRFGPLKIDLSPWPGLQAYVARVAARPGVRAALQAEGLLKDELAA
jgi:glutathione S-transferase